MNASTYAAHRLASHGAAQLARENEIIRSQAERHAVTGHPAHSTALAAILARFTRFSRPAPRRTTTIVAAR